MTKAISFIKFILYGMAFALYAVVCPAQLHYTIVGNGKQIRNGDVLYLVHKIKDKVIVDSTIANNNKFSFTGTVPEAVRATLYRNENPMWIDYAHESLDIYLESGTIQINSQDRLKNAVIDGTPLNETLQQLHLINKSII
ncbi:MAG: DUF4369 domain-containing protein [Chitinophagaceae bacterium]